MNKLQKSGIHTMQKPFLALLLGVAALTGCDNDNHVTAAPRDHINFTIHAEKEVANDVVMVDISIVRHGTNVHAMTKETNTDTAWAMNLAKQAQGVESKTTSFSTSSSYGGDDGTTPQTWNVDQGIHLESQDPQALSDLLGKLQEKAQISAIGYGISEGAREAAKAEMTTNAMAKFREKAQKVAGDMGYKQYEVVTLDIQSPDDALDSMMNYQAMGNYKGPVPRVKAMGNYKGAVPQFKEGNSVLEGGKEKLQMSIQAEIKLSGK